MSLKTIKKNYTSLLKVFSDAGVKINESQKEILDNFITDLENTMNENRDKAILATKKIVEEKMGNEYKKVVESIINHQKENAELAGKVQNKVVEINESAKLVNQVDHFLSDFVEEVLPKKTIVDYSKMQKLEQIHESLKEMLAVSDMTIDEKTVEMKEKLEKENSELTEKIAVFESKMNESTEKFEKMSDEISRLKAKEFITQKIKDLPILESKKILKKTEGLKLEEVKQNYKSIFESVQEEIKKEQDIQEEEKNLEEAITDILEQKNKQKASSEITCDKDVEGQENNPNTLIDDLETDDDDEIETVPVTESLMQSWIDTLNRITPQK